MIEGGLKNMGKKSQIIVFISFLLCGCLESEAKKAAADLLIDPDSAKFRMSAQ